MGAITVQIVETGETKSLSAIDHKTGVNWISDLLGNSGVYDLPVDNGGVVPIADDDGPTGIYRCSQDTYDWWVEYIDGMEDTADDLDQLSDDLADAGLDANAIITREYWAEVGEVDMADERRQAIALIESIRESHLKQATHQAECVNEQAARMRWIQVWPNSCRICDATGWVELEYQHDICPECSDRCPRCAERARFGWIGLDSSGGLVPPDESMDAFDSYRRCARCDWSDRWEEENRPGRICPWWECWCRSSSD